MLHELFEVVLGEVDAGFFVLLDLLQDGFVVIGDLVSRLIEFLDTLLVFCQCNLDLVLGVEAVVHDLLHLLLRHFSLLKIEKRLLDFDLQLFGLMAQVHILSFRFSVVLLFLIVLLQEQFGLIELGHTFLVVVLQVHFQRLDQVPIYQHRPVFKSVDERLNPIFQTIHGQVDLILFLRLLFTRSRTDRARPCFVFCVSAAKVVVVDKTAHSLLSALEPLHDPASRLQLLDILRQDFVTLVDILSKPLKSEIVALAEDHKLFKYLAPVFGMLLYFGQSIPHVFLKRIEDVRSNHHKFLIFLLFVGRASLTCLILLTRIGRRTQSFLVGLLNFKRRLFVFFLKGRHYYILQDKNNIIFFGKIFIHHFCGVLGFWGDRKAHV